VTIGAAAVLGAWPSLPLRRWRIVIAIAESMRQHVMSQIPFVAERLTVIPECLLDCSRRSQSRSTGNAPGNCKWVLHYTRIRRRWRRP
jgi:hypothetical protein